MLRFILLLPISLSLAACGDSQSASGGNSGAGQDSAHKENTVATPDTAPRSVERKAPEEVAEYRKPTPYPYHPPRQTENYEGENFGLVSQYYPLYWSADGKYAYFREPADEACGCYFLNFHIIDTQGDSLNYFTWEYTSDIYEEEHGKSLGESFDEVWKHKKDFFIEKMKEAGIRYGNGTFFESDEFDMQGVHYKAKLETRRPKNEDNYFDAVMYERVTVTPEGGEAKEVYEHEEKEFSLVLQSEVVRILVDPSEKYALIVLLHEERGYEGPPNVSEFKLVPFTP